MWHLRCGRTSVFNILYNMLLFLQLVFAMYQVGCGAPLALVRRSCRDDNRRDGVHVSPTSSTSCS